MNQLLKTGQKVQTDPSGLACEVKLYLGSGGQGEVFQATLAANAVALKWYYPESATPQQRAALGELVKRGQPNDRFLWPMELATAQGVAGFGYVMPLRESRYKGIVDLMKRRIEPSFRVLVKACRDLSHSYLELHSKGLCYRDISFGNVFFDPTSGEVLICDNDNVAVDKQAQGGILGTPRFMAPEIVLQKDKPSTQTDLFSLAVLLFYMLMMHHPLEGKHESAIHAMDLPAMNKLYGTDALFIFDPDNDSNRPDPQYHRNPLIYWPIYPQFLKDLFIQAFTKGIRDPDHRVRESQWWRAMAAIDDSLMYCGACGSENFYDAEKLRAAGKLAPCWSCKKDILLPPRLRIGQDVIMLNHDTRLFKYHIDRQHPYDFSKPVAEVTRHPSDPNIWGIRNMSTEKWTTVGADGTPKDIDPGRSVTIATGTKIQFGNSDGEIRA